MAEEQEQAQEEQNFEDAFAEFADDEPKEEAVQADSEQVPDVIEEEPVTIDWEARATAAEAQSKDWEHKFHSDAGRVGAMQRKINELQATEETPPSEAAVSEESPPELAEFKTDYPDIYQGVEQYMETEMQRRTSAMEEKFNQRFEPVNQLVHDQQRSAEMAALDYRHPDWKNVAQDAEFSEWVSGQPHQIQEMANSDFATDVSYVLDSFKTQSQPQQSQQRPAVQGIAQKREKQLANSTTVPSRSGTTANPLAEDDYESAFAYYAAK